MASQEYHIPDLNHKAEGVVANCVACILSSRKQGKQEGFLNPIDKSDVPLHTLHLYHLGPLPSTSKNYKYLFVVVDGFTKFTWIYAVKSTTTDEVIKKLELQSDVFGDPFRIITDRGTAFTSHALEEYCSESIIHVRITTGVARGNGQVERVNQTIISLLYKLSVAEPDKWFKHVSKAQRIINSSVTRSTKRSPFELMVGIPMRNKEDNELYRLIEGEIVDDFVAERRQMREDAKHQIQQIQEENRRNFNKRRKPATLYKIGDLVAIKRPQFGPGLKLHPMFLGPYEVVKIKDKDRYDVRKIGCHEGPNNTSCSADFMKPRVGAEDSDYTDEEDHADASPRTTIFIQDGRMWECMIADDSS